MSAESDLSWYFTEAAGDCGVRSIQGAIEARLNGAVGRSVEHDGEQDRRIASIRRLRRVFDRLFRLDARQRRLLSLQYSDPSRIGPCSLSLLSEFPDAVEGHKRAIHGGKSLGSSVRQWLLWLLVSSPERVMAMAEAAQIPLQESIQAYEALR